VSSQTHGENQLSLTKALTKPKVPIIFKRGRARATVLVAKSIHQMDDFFRKKPINRDA
jgi:hypothetical protein